MKAEELSKKQRAISVAEFFERNRHLLGFDNKRKALLTVIKEAVDNALDACEEAKVLPEIIVSIVDMGDDRYRISIEDNGPGIVKKQIPHIFARLLYGSKFHTMKQARGQQGIGISAAVLYGQLTTGRAARIKSRISPKRDAHYYEVKIDTKQNKPDIVKDEVIEWKKEHGVKIELDIEANYMRGDQSVDSYLKQTAIANPHATIVYTNPKAEQFIFPRAVEKLPKEPKEIKPHPHGVEIGILAKMLGATDARTLQKFLTSEFSRVGQGTAKEICQKSGLTSSMKPSDMKLQHIEMLIKGIADTKIIAPSTDCISPIGQEQLEKGLRKEIPAEFYTSVSRKPTVYKGIPFVVEVALAYGGNQPADKSAKVLRFANRVPLLYQMSSCASTKGVISTNWRSYGLSQSSGSLPQAPLTICVSLVSVWPPFTSEAKEAIAQYPEIMTEIKRALQEAGRKLGIYVRKKKRVAEQQKKVNIFEHYIPEVAQSIASLAGVSKERIMQNMRERLSKNIEAIREHQEKHKVKKVDKKTKEEQIELGGYE